MPVIYDVVGDWDGDEPLGASPSKPHSFGARHTRSEAEVLLAEQQERYAGTKWSFRIEEVETEGLFEIPPRPTPRERFTVRVSPREFVWGCIWGDDSSWKVQYLDSRASRKGSYVGRSGSATRSLKPESEKAKRCGRIREFIRLWSFEGDARVEFRSWQNFHVATGEPTDPWE